VWRHHQTFSAGDGRAATKPPALRVVLAVFAVALAVLLVCLVVLAPDSRGDCGAALSGNSSAQSCDAPVRPMPVPAQPGTPPGQPETILSP
jgi:hypothetical protein